MWPRPYLSNPTRMASKKVSDKPKKPRWRPKPTITYGNPLKTIEQLERENQPWVIARFPVRARFVEGEIGYCYEILLFQTIDRDEPNDNFTMSREEFREVLRKYGLTCHYRASRYGEIYAKDNRLRELTKLLQKSQNRQKNTLKAIRQKQYDLTDAASRASDPAEKERLRVERDLKRKEAEAFEKKMKLFHKGFCQEHNIIIYQF